MISIKMRLENCSDHRQGHWRMNNQDDNVVDIFCKREILGRITDTPSSL